MQTFRLDKEPWIPVLTASGARTLVSLQELFSGAEHWASLGGSPLEVASLTRFILAIAHLTKTPTSLDEWRAMYESRGQTMQRCAEYVADNGLHFDLFESRFPFGQDPAQIRTENPAHVLVYEAARKNNPILADHSVESDPQPVAPAALARAILASNAFAGASGGGYRSGPLAMRSVAMLQGPDLATTILLNLLVQKSSPAPFDWGTYGKPSSPNATLDLPRRYLWTSRSIRLLVDPDGQVRRLMLAPGNEMPEHERTEDPMVVFRLDSQGKTFVPLRLDAGRALWRSADVLLNWHDGVRKLAAVDQLRRLKSRGHIPAGLEVSMRVCAVAGDAQGPKTDLWRDESLPFDISILVDDSRFADLEAAVNSADDIADRTSSRIYGFALRYLQNGAVSNPDKSDVRRLSKELAPGLSDFWAQIAPRGEQIAVSAFDRAAWKALLDDAADRTFRAALDRLPPDARRFRAEFARDDKPREGANA